MFVFQANGDEKIGVVINKQPDDFVPSETPHKLEVITFNRNSGQAKEIEAAEKTAASARETVLSEINALPPEKQKAARDALAEFDKAVGAHETSMMNNIETRGGIAMSPNVMENVITTAHKLSMALGYGGQTADPVDGNNSVGTLKDASIGRSNTVFSACESVTVMSHELGKNAGDGKRMAIDGSGSQRIEFERAPKAGTADAGTPAAKPINCRIGGTLSPEELGRVQASYKQALQPTVMPQDNRKAAMG